MAEAPIVYEYGGMLYSKLEEFLERLALEYKTGNKDVVLAALEEYKLTLADIDITGEVYGTY